MIPRRTSVSPALSGSTFYCLTHPFPCASPALSEYHSGLFNGHIVHENSVQTGQEQTWRSTLGSLTELTQLSAGEGEAGGPLPWVLKHEGRL